jgi:hypothetical protein
MQVAALERGALAREDGCDLPVRLGVRAVAATGRERVVVDPEEVARQYGPYDYLVCVNLAVGVPGPPTQSEKHGHEHLCLLKIRFCCRC